MAAAAAPAASPATAPPCPSPGKKRSPPLLRGTGCYKASTLDTALRKAQQSGITHSESMVKHIEKHGDQGKLGKSTKMPCKNTVVLF
ncbi:UNVERIFIED_CONTAM: hypothetical protein FKN15_027231 [Acipenser sinensis]